MFLVVRYFHFVGIKLIKINGLAKSLFFGILLAFNSGRNAKKGDAKDERIKEERNVHLLAHEKRPLRTTIYWFGFISDFVILKKTWESRRGSGEY